MLTDSELAKIYKECLDRDREVIRAMQQRAARNPIRHFMWRKPWKSPSKTHFSFSKIGFLNLISWLARAHDCSDPAVGCSCSGGFRFP